MALISALFSLLSRRLGQLLRAVFGWSIAGLFGKLSSSKQTGLSIAMVLSLAWPLLVVGAFAPHVAAWALAFVPLHEWVGDGVLRVIWIVLALLAPLVVGLIASWVAPNSKQGSRVRSALAGYRLTIGFFVSFVITLVVVPALKLAAMARRWQDEHVFVQVKEGQYAQAVADLHSGFERAGIAAEVAPVPTVMALPLRVLKWFARGGFDAVVPDDPKMLRAAGVEVYLYPADLLLRGEHAKVARVRAAVVREMMRAPVYLTEDPASQHVEDEIDRLWDVMAAHRDRGGLHGGALARIGEVARELATRSLPYGDWMILYTDLTRLEREMGGGPRLVDRALAPSNSEGETMKPIDPRAEASTGQLVKDAIDEVRHLLKTEVALAREEVRHEVRGVKTTVLAFAGAAFAMVLGVAFLLIAFAIATAPNWVPGLVVGLVLVALGAGAAFLGYRAMPKKPMEHTKERLETDVQILKERIA